MDEAIDRVHTDTSGKIEAVEHLPYLLFTHRKKQTFEGHSATARPHGAHCTPGFFGEKDM